jgi:3-isopropylmalate/(R)-2-methylmalate dehydratase large subunit
LSPLVSGPHVVDRISKVADLAGTRIDQAHVGTCTNGRLSDIAAVAGILSGRRIAPGVRFIVTPASREVYQGSMRAGHLETLIEAGAIVTAPGCGACMGDQSGVLGAGEVCISSGNRNSRGRMGSPESAVFLASAETVAASAIAGQITDPRAI